ncbi:MAG: hypothetical protein QXQ57_03990 [Sulfolobales archaeon]
MRRLILFNRCEGSPELGTVELLERYRVALKYVLYKILSSNLKTLRDMSTEPSTERSKEVFGLPLKMALDCYRDALAIAMSW